MQPQLEILSLKDLILFEEGISSRQGHITLCATMKNWKYPCLKTLLLESSNMNGDEMLLENDDMVALVEGMANCSNLEHVSFSGNYTISEVGLRALSSLFRSNKLSLHSLDLSSMRITDDGINALAPGLASLISMKRLNLSGNDIGDEGLKVLATGLVGLRHLEELNLSNNEEFSAIGLTTLSSVMQTASSLKSLELMYNEIDDEGLQSFMVGMDEYCRIERLDLSDNAISSGVRSLAGLKSLRRLRLEHNYIGENDEAMEALVEAIESLCNLEYISLNGVVTSRLSDLAVIFQSQTSCLQDLDLCETNIEDSEAIALANGLRGNQALTSVRFQHDNITDVGWRAFERLLCDASSVGNTYRSNHTLEIIGNPYMGDYPTSIKVLLRINEQKVHGFNVPICKILKCHSRIDMTPLLQWKLKLLPFVVAWFEIARSSRLSGPRAELECRKLSAVFQFVSGISHSVVEGYVYSKERTGTLLSRKRKINQ